MLRIQWVEKLSNEKVLEKARTKRDLLNNIMGRQLRFIGHGLREGDIEKGVAEGEITGKKARGRQRQKMLDNMKTRLVIKTLKDLVEVAKDRERWRRLTKIEEIKEPHHDRQRPGKDMTKEEDNITQWVISETSVFNGEVESTRYTAVDLKLTCHYNDGKFPTTMSFSRHTWKANIGFCWMLPFRDVNCMKRETEIIKFRYILCLI